MSDGITLLEYRNHYRPKHGGSVIGGWNCFPFVNTWIQLRFLVRAVLLIILVCGLFVFVLCLLHPMLPVTLHCPFLIAPSVFSNSFSYIKINDLYTRTECMIIGSPTLISFFMKPRETLCSLWHNIRITLASKICEYVLQYIIFYEQIISTNIKSLKISVSDMKFLKYAQM